MNGLKSSILKMEKVISQIGENRGGTDTDEQTFQKIQRLRNEREKLDRGRGKGRIAAIVEKKMLLGDTIASCFDEDIILNDNFIEQLLSLVENNKEKIIEGIKE